MKILIVNVHNNDGPLDFVNTGFSAIGLSLTDHDIKYRNIFDVADNLQADYYSDENDIVIIGITDIDATLKVAEFFRQEGSRIVVFEDGRFDKIDYLHLAGRVNYYKIVNDIADIVLVNSLPNHHCLGELVGYDKVRNVGFPVNIDLIEKAYNNSDVEQELDLIWQGNYGLPHLYTTMLCVKIAQNLGYRSLVTSFMEQDVEFHKSIFADIGWDSVELCKPLMPEQYILQYLSRCAFAIYAPVRASLARVAAESAVIGIPSIGTPSYFQERLFPDLTIPYLDISLLKAMIEKLADDSFVFDVLARAKERVEAYRPETFEPILLDAIMEW